MYQKIIINTILICFRPKSKYAAWEDPPQDGEPFDYDAVPTRFYFEVESAGNLEPDSVIQQGIRVLQQKLAVVIQDLGEEDTAGGMNGADSYAPRSPDVGVNGGAGWADSYTTPFGNSGQANSWEGGAATPFVSANSNSKVHYSRKTW